MSKKRGADALKKQKRLFSHGCGVPLGYGIGRIHHEPGFLTGITEAGAEFVFVGAAEARKS